MPTLDLRYISRSVVGVDPITGEDYTTWRGHLETAEPYPSLTDYELAYECCCAPGCIDLIVVAPGFMPDFPLGTPGITVFEDAHLASREYRQIATTPLPGGDCMDDGKRQDLIIPATSFSIRPSDINLGGIPLLDGASIPPLDGRGTITSPTLVGDGFSVSPEVWWYINHTPGWDGTSEWYGYCPCEDSYDGNWTATQYAGDEDHVYFDLGGYTFHPCHAVASDASPWPASHIALYIRFMCVSA